MSLITSVLVCPICKGQLFAGISQRKELVCPYCNVAYEINSGIPCMIPTQARHLTEEEAKEYKKLKETKAITPISEKGY